MNKLYKKYRVVGNWINVGIMATVLLPLLFLARFNHPSPADDYCYIDTVFKYGWLEAMNYYYSGWTGRYFGILLNHSNPLLFHSVLGFRVLSVLLLLTVVGTLYVLMRHLTPTLSRMAHLGFAGVLFFLYILNMASVVEAYYWMASFVTYTVPNILTLLWLVLALRWYRQDSPKPRRLLAFVAGFMVFAVIGSSETNLLVMVLLIGTWWLYKLIYSRKVDGFMIGMLLTAVVSCYFFFTSPGNQARMGANPLGGDLMFSFISSFQKVGLLSIDWVFKSPLVFFTILWVYILSKLSAGARNYFSLPIWIAVLGFVGVVTAQLFPSYYGVGIEPTPRVVNCVYFFFLLGWFYVAGVIYHHYRVYSQAPFLLSEWRFGMVYVVLLLMVALGFYRSANVKMIYSDILLGRAAAFDRENNQRYALLKDSKEAVVYLPALKVRPQSLFVEDIKPEKDHWWNKCMAGYFGKEAIYMID
ncbi:hypothetical protein CLV98_108109 [Dyadobacter jejuensis]|uniref:4-amino-4-deoxy-L-arabinose transferase-like glycosyltransferase n=1 Tax=Dyadobacter jejuensis TaxID=1082580 RepID=A0A316AIY2_9BACT|nr:DUF6056 family protein [Dyadobacter jejuensis]PWJ57189.1 hypothetical protein CLV98_108109 [Dyadobacter jejuensis]